MTGDARAPPRAASIASRRLGRGGSDAAAPCARGDGGARGGRRAARRARGDGAGAARGGDCDGGRRRRSRGARVPRCTDLARSGARDSARRGARGAGERGTSSSGALPRRRERRRARHGDVVRSRATPYRALAPWPPGGAHRVVRRASRADLPRRGDCVRNRGVRPARRRAGVERARRGRRSPGAPRRRARLDDVARGRRAHSATARVLTYRRTNDRRRRRSRAPVRVRF